MKPMCTLGCACMFILVTLNSLPATDMDYFHGSMAVRQTDRMDVDCRYSDWNDASSWPYPTKDSSGFLVLQPADSAAAEKKPQEFTSSSVFGAYPPTPEPVTLLLIGAGLIGLATFRKKLN
jgi:hypothetical protein